MRDQENEGTFFGVPLVYVKAFIRLILLPFPKKINEFENLQIQFTAKNTSKSLV